MGLVFLFFIFSCESEQKKEIKKVKEYLVIIDYPANLYKHGFRTTWEIGKVPIGTKLEILDDYIWRSPIIDHKVKYYKVKFKGVLGWISEYSCKKFK